MMNIIFKKIIISALTFCLLLTVGSCSLFDLDINEDPNNPKEVSLNLLLSETLLRGSELFGNTINMNLHGFVAVTTSQDQFSLNNQTYNNTWQSLYYGPLKDLDEIINAATEQGNNPHYLGIAQVLKAYYFSLMVDVWGEIPYSEAFQGNAENIIKYPKYDDGATIYTDLFSLIDQAVENLAKTSPVTVEGDPIYGGNAARWTKAAKTLKLRLLIQTRRVQDNTAAITALINEGDLISADAEDFTFQFNGINNPENDNRHPWYIDGYSGTEYGLTYFGHQFMVEMLENEDPRRPFYMMRQTSTVLNQDDPTQKQNTPCSQITGCLYGYLVLNPNVIDRLYTNKGKSYGAEDEAFIAGIFGRDRSDPSGIPLDGSLRTAMGAYPIGGLYDDGTVQSASNNKGSGAGIFPMITSVNTKFYEIEAMLTLGVPGDPRTLFEAAIREHIGKVVNLASSLNLYAAADTLDPDYINLPLDTAINNYVDLFMTKYDNAPSNEAKLNVVMKQAWFSNLGNGYELYNAFRRTGYPTGLQEPMVRIRQFPLRLPIAQDDLTLNQNAPANPPIFDRDAVFWDVLKFSF